MSSAGSLPAADVQVEGSGLVKLDAAVGTRTSTPTRATPAPKAPACRRPRRRPLMLDDATLTGEKDIFDGAFDSTVHAGLAENVTAWTGGDLNGRTWASGGWR